MCGNVGCDGGGADPDGGESDLVVSQERRLATELDEELLAERSAKGPEKRNDGNAVVGRVEDGGLATSNVQDTCRGEDVKVWQISRRLRDFAAEKNRFTAAILLIL